MQLSVEIVTPAMRASSAPAEVIVRSNLSHRYWTPGRMVTHLASNGCPLEVGDLIGSGAVSGPHDAERACLAELTQRGTAPLTLSSGESRAWLQDGDTINLRGRAVREGFVSIGFGPCEGTVLASPVWPG